MREAERLDAALTATIPCAECPHTRGAHYRTHDGLNEGCAACECDGFSRVKRDGRDDGTPLDPEQAERLAGQGMTIFRLIVERNDAVRERDAAVARAMISEQRIQELEAVTMHVSSRTIGKYRAWTVVVWGWRVSVRPAPWNTYAWTFGVNGGGAVKAGVQGPSEALGARSAGRGDRIVTLHGWSGLWIAVRDVAMGRGLRSVQMSMPMIAVGMMRGSEGLGGGV